MYTIDPNNMSTKNMYGMETQNIKLSNIRSKHENESFFSSQKAKKITNSNYDSAVRIR